eukprot:Colp12_sorted_trinity150504_noHs@7379
MASYDIELVVDQHAGLAEGPIYDANRKKLLWIDIPNAHLFEYDPLTNENITHVLNCGSIGTVVPVSNAFRKDIHGASVHPDDLHVMLGVKDGISVYDGVSKILSPIAATSLKLAPNARMNDGKCDPRGRFWAGSITRDIDGEVVQGASELYCLNNDYTITTKLTGVSVSNGIAWTQDASRMLYIDSPTKTIDVFNYDADTGAISDRRTAIDLTGQNAYPDGCTLDAHGHLWTALYKGHAVVCHDVETGKLLHTVTLPDSQVTAVAFGGPDLADLYITTARENFSELDSAAEPHAGGLYRVRGLQTRGLPAQEFIGF